MLAWTDHDLCHCPPRICYLCHCFIPRILIYPLAPSSLFCLPNRQNAFLLKKIPTSCWASSALFRSSISFPDPTPNCPQCNCPLFLSRKHFGLDRSWGGVGWGRESSLEKGKKTSPPPTSLSKSPEFFLLAGEDNQSLAKPYNSIFSSCFRFHEQSS